MPAYFPEIEPHDNGRLDVGDGHQVYWESVGNPDGVPVVFLHGGPGSGSSPGQRRLFDPDRYRAILIDQRGCGRSLPLAEESLADLTTNTTHHLIADVEAVRDHLRIDRWRVVGLSWGTTLALAYAETHPERVGGMVLGLVTTTSEREVEWLTEGVGRLFPQQWERFAEAVPEQYKGIRLVDAYAEMLQGPDEDLREHAARAWCAWEDAHVSLGPGHRPSAGFADPVFRRRFALLVTHYWRHAAFMGPDQLVREVSILDGIPGILIHGRYDVSSPLETPWRISQSWATSRLEVLEDSGHGDSESFPVALMEAIAEIHADRA